MNNVTFFSKLCFLAVVFSVECVAAHRGWSVHSGTLGSMNADVPPLELCVAPRVPDEGCSFRSGTLGDDRIDDNNSIAEESGVAVTGIPAISISPAQDPHVVEEEVVSGISQAHILGSYVQPARLPDVRVVSSDDSLSSLSCCARLIAFFTCCCNKSE